MEKGEVILKYHQIPHRFSQHFGYFPFFFGGKQANNLLKAPKNTLISLSSYPLCS